MIENLIDKVTSWANQENEIDCVILVGSYARGTQKTTSDIDFCIVTTNKEGFLKESNFITQFGVVEQSQIEFYGACTSLRVWYKDGPEVEFGFVEPSWLAQPLDAGTKKVLLDGFQMLVDKSSAVTNIQLDY